MRYFSSSKAHNRVNGVSLSFSCAQFNVIFTFVPDLNIKVDLQLLFDVVEEKGLFFQLA